MPHPAPDPDTPAPRCPECATPAAEATPLVPWWLRHRRAFQVAALLAAISFVSYKQWRHWPAPPGMTIRKPGAWFAELPGERVSLNDLETMADAQSTRGDGHRLLDAFGRVLEAPTIHADTQLHTGLTHEAGHLISIDLWGWPGAFVTYHGSGTFDDVYTLEGRRDSPPRPARVGWHGLTWTGTAPHAVLRERVVQVTPGAIAPELVIVIAGWLVGGIASSAMTAARSWAGRPRRDGRRLLPWIGAAVAMALVITLSLAWPLVGTHRRPLAQPRVAPSGLTIGDLRAMPRPSSDRVIARAILATADRASPAADTLAISWAQPYTQSSGQLLGFWPLDTFFAHFSTRRYDGVEPTGSWGPSRWSVHSSRASVSIMRQETTGPLRYRQYSANITQASWLLLGLYAAWLAPLIPIRLAMWRLNQRARRRFARGQCVRCGYDGVRPAVP